MKIFFSVGEPSGDIHGANLIRALRRQYALRGPEAQPLRCVGFGGPRMKEAGCEIHFDLTSLAVMWVMRVLWNIRKFFRLADEAEAYFRDERPDAVILIDYPGFNWHIARRAKKHGIPVFYYSPPQVWAWRAGRVKKMRKFTDMVFSGLPFECEWLKAHGCNAVYVGHPFFDEVDAAPQETELTREFQAEIAARKKMVALLPGSRNQEVRQNFPTFLNVATRMISETPRKKNGETHGEVHGETPGQSPDIFFVVAAYKESQAEMIREMIQKAAARDAALQSLVEKNGVRVVTGRTPEVIRSATCCLSVSGSVSLELLYYEKPSVIGYRVPRYGWWAQWWFRTVKYITLVNLLVAENPFRNYNWEYTPRCADAKEILFPEYLSYRDRSGWMANDLLGWLRNATAYAETVRRLRELKARVAQPGAAEKAAEMILKQQTISHKLLKHGER